MADGIRARLTFSNIVAVIALFIALGGSVYAAATISGKQIKKGSIPGNRLKQGAVTGKQVKAGSLPGDRLGPATVSGDRLQADGITGAQVDETSLGTVPSAAVGGPVAFAAVKADGTVSPARSRGIATANITVAGSSSYCFDNLPSFAGAQATVTYDAPGELAANTIARVAVPDFPGTAVFNTDCPGAELEVTTSNSGGASPHAFFLAIYK